jgi:hypothetical protein
MAKRGRPRGGRNPSVIREYWREASKRYYERRKDKKP